MLLSSPNEPLEEFVVGNDFRFGERITLDGEKVMVAMECRHHGEGIACADVRFVALRVSDSTCNPGPLYDVSAVDTTLKWKSVLHCSEADQIFLLMRNEISRETENPVMSSKRFWTDLCEGAREAIRLSFDRDELRRSNISTIQLVFRTVFNESGKDLVNDYSLIMPLSYIYGCGDALVCCSDSNGAAASFCLM